MKWYLALCLVFSSVLIVDTTAKRLDELIIQDNDEQLEDNELEHIKPVEIVNQPLELVKGSLFGCSSLMALYLGAQNLMSGLKGLQDVEDRYLTIALRLIAAMALFEMAATKGSHAITSFNKVFN